MKLKLYKVESKQRARNKDVLRSMSHVSTQLHEKTIKP